MKLTPIAEATGNTVPRPLTSEPVREPVIFTAEEARRGRAMRGNTLHYCCYGMYCDAGHTSDCTIMAKLREWITPGVSGAPHQTFSQKPPMGGE